MQYQRIPIHGHPQQIRFPQAFGQYGLQLFRAVILLGTGHQLMDDETHIPCFIIGHHPGHPMQHPVIPGKIQRAVGIQETRHIAALHQAVFKFNGFSGAGERSRRGQGRDHFIADMDFHTLHAGNERVLHGIHATALVGVDEVHPGRRHPHEQFLGPGLGQADVFIAEDFRPAALERLLLAPYTAWASLFILVPLAFIAYYAFTDSNFNFTLDNVTKFFTATSSVTDESGVAQEVRTYLLIFWRSLKLAIISTIICLLMGYPMAYIMARASSRVQKTMVTLIMIPMWMNFLIRTYAWMTILQDTGILNSILSFLHLGTVKIIGTDCAAIDRAENRDAFEKLLKELGIPQPEGRAVTKIEDGVAAAAKVGYPVLVRPSFVLGGRAMQIVANEEQLRHYLKTAVEIDEDKPVLVDKYISGKEVEVDAICDGHNVFVPGIMELVERTGVHSGDSISVYPAFSISDKVKGTILQYAKKLGRGIGIVGLYNIQFIVDKNDEVFIIEVNPRSSRTVPFLSKATGYSLADIATECILGKSLKEQGIFCLYPEEKKRWYVKVPVFSFNKLRGLDAYLSPEMKSTGEAIGYDDKFYRALYKALQASGMHLQNYGTVFATIADCDKAEALPLIRRFYNLGFNIEATSGTAKFLKENGIRTHVLKKLSEDSDEIAESLRQGHIAYVINTSDPSSSGVTRDGFEIRKYATENNVTMFTSLDTVRVLLDVLEETTLTISTIDA